MVEIVVGMVPVVVSGSCGLVMAVVVLVVVVVCFGGGGGWSGAGDGGW